MAAGSRGFGRHNSRNSRNSRQGNKVQHDTQQALAFINQGRLQEAEVIYKRLIQQGAGSHVIFGNLGAICIMQGRHQEAATFLKQALAIKPNFPDALGNLGIALKNQGDLDAAVASYRKALAMKPDFPDALANLGDALKEQGNLDAAVASYGQALDLKPNYPEALNSLGVALWEQDNPEAAIASYRKALELRPNYPEVFNGLGVALWEQGSPEAAIASYRKALELRPNYLEVLNNLGAAFVEQGDLEAAIAYHKKVVALDCENSEYHYNLSYVLLLSGDYDNGLEEYEWRLKKKHVSNILHAHPPVPQWNGHHLSSKETLMLISEQGMGDILQFMRYVPYLKAFYPGMDVAFCAKPKLHGLILSSGITPRVHTPEEGNSFTAGKCLPLVSLLKHLKVSPEQPLVQTPYIKAPAEKIHHWQGRLATEKRPIIGIHWQGNRKSEQILKNSSRLTPLRKSRSLPLEAFAPISAATAATFLSLQKGFGTEQLDHCSFRHRFVACQDDINEIWDFVETAAMIANCDLIITNDTSLAHLAGGMGQPTWLLLNKRSEWRWGMEGDTTFWYPSMRLFRQREWGNWAEVMERVVETLKSPPIKEVESLVPAETTLPPPGQADDIHHPRYGGEQQALAFINQGRLQEAEAVYRKLIQQGAGSHVIFGNLGAICIMQGRHQEAATFLRQALAIQPDFPDALGNLGIALRNQGDLAAAIASYRKALAMKPDFPDALTNLGDALKEQGDLDAAVASYRQALHLKPNYPEALNGLGAALWEQDNPDAAIASYRKALNLKPNYPEALNGLGVALWEQGNPEAAIASYRKALDFKPNSPETLNNLGTALGEQGDLEAAIDAYQKALALKPQYPEALSNLGNVLTKQGRSEAAIDAYQKALAIKPDFTDALSNLGKTFKDQGKMDAAIDSYQKALAIRPDSKELLLGLASTLPETGDLQTAVELARKAVSLDPDDGSSHLSLALWLFLSGDYGEGWQEYKWRFAANKILHSHALPKLEEWNGNNHTPGERLTVISEQGLGDTLQFMRYIPYLNTMGMEVCFCAQPKLHGLIQTSGLTTTLCDPDTASGFTTGKWISLLSLPAYLKVGPHNPLTDTAYLKAPQPQVLHWQQKLAAEHGPVIGLNWQGNPQAEKDGHLKGRSLPLAALAPLTQATAASFLSLQKGPGSEQLMDCSFKHRFVACQEEINQTWDFLDTAAIVVNCDLIITVDTAVAHLAAGLGKPTWLLLKRVPDWRWGMEGDTSFWYPSMRLFRQRERGNWVAVMERVVEALKTLPIKEAEPIKTTSPPLGQADDIHHAQYEGEQQALAFINQGQLQEAEAIYKRLIQQGAGSHVVFGNLGAICVMQGKHQEAATFLRQALAIQPDFPDALGNLGIALKNQGDLDAAVASYRKALAMKPDFPDALANLGDALKEQGDLDAAVASYRQALNLKPNYPEALNSLGVALWEQDHPEAAIASYRKALELKPNYPEVLNSLGVALVDQGNLEAAITSHRKAVSLDHENPDYHYNLASFLFLSGDYDNGWEEYEWRLQKKVGALRARPPTPQWNGHHLSSEETLMLVSEQGLGDTLQFMRYVPYLKTFCPGMDVAFCAQPKLHDLILCSGITPRVHTPEEANAFTAGKWLPLLSLPRHLKVSPSQPLVQTPYIKVPAEKVHHWQERLATEERPIIGIHWQGNRESEQIFGNSSRLAPLRRSRSLPLEAFAPISAATAATFLSLQKGDGTEQLDHCPFRHRFVACQDEVNQIWDFVETAAMVANCDLIITNDTALAHLAGGLGQPTWLLLKKVPDWRWGMEGDTTFWYPSIRFFRQRERGNWAEVMERVVEALKAPPAPFEAPGRDGVERVVEALKAPPALQLEPPVPAETTLPTPGQDDDIHHHQYEGEQQALALINQGQLQEAEAIYKRLIQQGIKSHLVFGNLGAICTMQGRNQEAITFLREALAIQPDFPDALGNLGIALKNQGDPDAAVASYRQALDLKPNYPEALNALGVALWEQDNLEAAIASYRKALELKPNYPEALNGLGVALWEQGNPEAAIASYRKALELKPSDPETLNNLGIALGEQGDLDAAVDAYQKALALKPKDPEALSNLGNVLTKQGRPEAAIDAYQKALAIKPDFTDALSNLGKAFKDQGKMDAAIASYRKALALRPDSQELLLNLAAALSETGDLQTAIELAREAVSLDPDDASGHLGLAIWLFLSGDYGNGWNEYEWRHKAKYGSPPLVYPPVPQWHGKNLPSGDTLMLISEGGLGDTLQFMRYVPYLNKLGMDVAFCAQPKLHDLILSSGIGTRVHTPAEAKVFTAGTWLPLLSLPRHLKVTPLNPLVQTPYIKVPAEKIHHWQEKLATEKRPIIGIHWRGNRESEKISHNRQDLIPLQRSRSLPLGAFAPISAATTATFLSLQKGDGTEQLDHCPFRHRFVACQDEINRIWDFAETAAMVANCDLIITNDTALAHLAGGMGKTTWLLLKKVPDWRWGMDGDTTFWYPSMHLFRQRESGNWVAVMERVVEALKAPPTKGAESLVPVKTTSHKSRQVDDIHHAQHKEDKQQALAFINQGRLQEAEAIYKRLIQQGTGNHLVFGNLGAICNMQGKHQEAVTFLKQALAINPRDPEVLFNLGVSLLDQGERQAAIDSYQKAIALNPNSPKALFNLGNALKEQGHLEAAIDAYQKAIAIQPAYTKALFNLANTLKDQGDLDAAIVSYRKILDLKPNSPEALNSLGLALWQQGNLDAAIVSYHQALDLKPNYAKALNNLGLALLDQGNPEASAFSFRKAVSLDYENSGYHYGLAYALLSSNDYDNGWQEYEWRFKRKHGAATVLYAHPPVPQWNGQNHSPGETLMLVSEQGLGDTLQFMRYVPYLKTLFPDLDVAFCAQPKLYDLILSSGICTRVHTPEEANAFTSGKWLPLLSLPRHLKVSPSQPLVQASYIKAPAERVHHWQEKLATEKRPIIGIHWQGRTLRELIHGSQRLVPLWKRRSLPLEAFAPISAATAATFLSLQKGDGSEQMVDCPFRHRFVACQDEINQIWDFVETAAMVANCDLIITNDTALAHLAGGMGQPTWLLLNKGSEWRWGMEGDTTFWYPSMRLFRQREWGNWAEVMERVARVLEALPGDQNYT